VLGGALGARDQAQQLILGQLTLHAHIGELRLADGEGPRLVERDRIERPHALQRRGVL